jgi:hypothetical protein
MSNFSIQETLPTSETSEGTSTGLPRNITIQTQGINIIEPTTPTSGEHEQDLGFRTPPPRNIAHMGLNYIHSRGLDIRTKRLEARARYDRHNLPIRLERRYRLMNRLENQLRTMTRQRSLTS